MWGATPSVTSFNQPGDYEVTVIARDDEGDIGLSPTFYVRVPDKITGVISEISPNPRNVPVGAVQIRFSEPIQGFDLADLTLTLDNGPDLLGSGTPQLTSTDDQSWTLDNLTVLTGNDGIYSLLLEAATAGITDLGSTKILDVDLIGGWTMDTVAPVVTVDSQNANSSRPAITGTVDDPNATIVVTIDSEPYPAINNGDTWTLPAGTIAPLAAGTYDVSVTATDQAGNVGQDQSMDELILGQLPDLLATSFAASPDHILGGVTTVSYTIQNQGNGPAADFDLNIVVSNDATIGNEDDVVVDTFTVAGGLGAGATFSDSKSIQIDVATLLDWAEDDDPAGLGPGRQSTSSFQVAVVIDPGSPATDAIDETNDLNNFNRGQGLDLDNVTFFPWDLAPFGSSGNGLVSPTDVVFVVNRLGLSNPADADFDELDVADIDGSELITPTDANGVLSRLGYEINCTVFEDACDLAAPAANEGDGVATVEVALQLVDLNGQPGIELDETFDVELHFSDVSGLTPEAVFSAYADIAFDDTRLQLTGVDFDEDFASGQSGLIQSAGVDELGAIAGFTPASDTRVATLHFTALSRGLTEVHTAAPDKALSEITIYSVDTDQRATTEYGSLFVQIDDAVDVALTLVELDDEPGIKAGETFNVEVDMTDMRFPLDPRSVFAGYLDVLFDPGMIYVEGMTFASGFPLQQSGENVVQTGGVIDELGAVAALTETTTDPPTDSHIVTLHLTAIAEGTTTISTDAPEAAGSEVVLFGADDDFRSSMNHAQLELEISRFALPVVESVTVANSNWSDAFLGELDANGLGHDVLAGVGYQIPKGLSQLTALGWSALDTLIVSFSVPVVVGADDLVLQSSGGVAAPTVESFEQLDLVTVKWQLAEDLSNHTFFLQINDSAQSRAAVSLDGEWQNGITTTTSGNGVAGGDFSFQMNVLTGDVNRDGLVGSADTGLLFPALGLGIGADSYTVFADINGSGTVAVNDLATIRSSYGQQVDNDGAFAALTESPVTSDVSATRDATRRVAVLRALDTIYEQIDEGEDELTEEIVDDLIVSKNKQFRPSRRQRWRESF